MTDPDAPQPSALEPVSAAESPGQPTGRGRLAAVGARAMAWLKPRAQSGWRRLLTGLRAQLPQSRHEFLQWTLEGLRRARPFLLIYGFFLILAVWAFWPIFARLDEALVGRPGSDVLRNAWGFWWVKAMLLERLRVPAFTVYLNFPRGMMILLIDPLNCLLSIPLQLVFDLPAAYNLFLIGAVAFSAFGACLFARHLTDSWPAGLLAGTLFGFAPYVLGSSLSGNSEVVNVGWIPLFLLYFHKALHSGAKRDGIRAGIMLVCTTLTSWYYGYIISIFAALYLVGFFLLQTARRRPLKPPASATAWGLLVFGIFSLTMLAIFHDIIPAVRQGASQGGVDMRTVLAGNGVNLWDVYQPSRDRWDRPSLYHLPPFLLMAFPLALILGFKRAWPWALLSLPALILSLSFKTQWHPVGLRQSLWPLWDQLTVLGTSSYEVFLNLPLSRILRFPARFMVVVNLMLAVVMACGLKPLLVDRFKRVWMPLSLVLSVGLAWHLLELARFHEIFSVTTVKVPPHVRKLAEDKHFVAMVNLPTDLQGNLQLYQQAIHQKPLLNYVDFVTSRLYYLDHKLLPLSVSDALYGMQMRGYDDYLKAYPPEVPPWPTQLRAAEQLERLQKAGLAYIAVDRSKYRPEHLAEFETLVKPFVRKVISAEGFDLYHIE